VKLLRYGPKGYEQPGLLDGKGTLRSLSEHVPDIRGTALLPDKLAQLRSLDSANLPIVEGEPRIGPCVAGVGKIICVGLNYSDHAAESGMAEPTEPVLQDFLVEDHPISRVGDHLKRVTGGAEGDESYATFFPLASFRALTPR